MNQSVSQSVNQSINMFSISVWSYWCYRAGIREQCCFYQQSGGGWGKDEVMPLVGVSA